MDLSLSLISNPWNYMFAIIAFLFSEVKTILVWSHLLQDNSLRYVFLHIALPLKD